MKVVERWRVSVAKDGFISDNPNPKRHPQRYPNVDSIQSLKVVRSMSKKDPKTPVCGTVNDNYLDLLI